jgi:hypothetical protein
MKITKLDAAKQQIEMAIVLFFNNNDPISTHTLTNAAYEILVGVGERKNVKPIVKRLEFLLNDDQLKQIGNAKIKDARKMAVKILNTPYNFMKHGKNDPTETLEFEPQFNEAFLWDACRMYVALTNSMTDIMEYFIAYVCSNYIIPKVKAKDDDEKKLLVFIRDLLGKLNKETFPIKISKNEKVDMLAMGARKELLNIALQYTIS